MKAGRRIVERSSIFRKKIEKVLCIEILEKQVSINAGKEM